MRAPGLLPAVFLACATAAAQDGAIAGHYMEDRSNRVFGCPCEQSSDWVNAGREAVLAWDIQSGNYAGQDLAGLRMAAVLAGEYILSEGTSARRSTLFVDAAASPSRRRAGLAWILAQYEKILGRVVAAHSVPIDLRFDPESVVLRVGDALNLTMRRTRFEQDTQPWAKLLYEPFTPLTETNFGTTLKVQYAGPDLNTRWTRVDSSITGYYGKFLLKPST